MTEALKQLIPQLQQLSPSERGELLDFLLTLKEPEDDPAEVEAAWKAEIARRREEMLSGKVVGIPGDQVIAELREEFP